MLEVVMWFLFIKESPPWELIPQVTILLVSNAEETCGWGLCPVIANHKATNAQWLLSIGKPRYINPAQKLIFEEFYYDNIDYNKWSLHYKECLCGSIG